MIRSLCKHCADGNHSHDRYTISAERDGIGTAGEDAGCPYIGCTCTVTIPPIEVYRPSTITKVIDVLDKLEEEVEHTSYRPRYDEGMTKVIRAVRESLGVADA